MIIIGVDLSGPRSPGKTAVSVFAVDGDRLRFRQLLSWSDDGAIFELAQACTAMDDTAIGLDAPLSYGKKSGQRAADAELRQAVVQAGLHPGSVMAPTAPRMAYLSLRGISVARGLQLLPGSERLRIVETHPGAALALGGAPIAAVRTFKKTVGARGELLKWLAD